MKRRFLYAERCSIMERIRERCSTDVSPQAECGGRLNDFVTVYAFPYQTGMPSADFAWSTADRISKAGGIFRLK